MKASSAIATSHDESNGIEADDAEMKPLLDPLSMLLALVRAESEVQVSQKLAKIQLATATSELHNMKHNFPKFPSIEERMKKGKSTADQEVAKLERQLKINREAQPGLAKSLAAAFLNISSRAEEARRVPEVSPDAVTRQEFKALQDRFTRQQEMLEKQRGQFTRQQEMLEKQQDQLTRQQDLVDNQQTLIETLQSSHTESKNTAFQAREQANTTESEMIKDLAKLENQLQNIEASVHSGVDRVRKEMQPQLDNIVQDGNRARTAAERHETAVTQITEKLDVQGKVINQLSIKVEAATSTASDAQKGLTKLEERLTATKITVGQIGANEQRVVKQSLREYDQKLSDLSTLVESLRSEHVRVHEDLAQNAKRVKDEPKPASTPTRSEDQAADAATGTLIAQMEEKLIANAANTEAALAYLRSELRDDIDAQEETLSGAQNEQGAELARTKEQLASLAQKVNGLEEQASTFSSGIQRLEQSQQTSDENHAQTGAAYVSMRDAVKSLQSNLQMLQAKTTSLSDNVAALEKRSVPTAQMPAPAAAAATTAAQDAAQFRPVGQLATQSPRGSNSRSGSASGLANGVQSPRNPASPFGSGFPNGAPLPGIDALSNQIRGIAGNVASLKQRMDNLTTEEIFRAMSDQFISAYPGTKEFPAIVDALQAVNANLEARLDSSDSKVTMLHGNQTDLRRRFDELANRVVEGQVRTSEVEEEVTVLRKDVETNMAAARNDFEGAVGIQTDVIVNLRHQVQALADTAFGPPDGA
jgi:hypothetical protein